MQDSHSCDPGSIPGRRMLLLPLAPFWICKVFLFSKGRTNGSLAEWSKALVLGTSPKGRGFESLSCQINNFTLIDKRWVREKVVFAPGEARTHNPGISQVLSISTVR